jgi:hypothetical protein
VDTPLHRDAASAWRYLREHGGLETEGRDEGLEERLVVMLNPDAFGLGAR